MIEVHIAAGRRELARVRITRAQMTFDGKHADYIIEFAVDTAGDSLAIYTKTVWNFPRKDLNVLALIRLALESMTEEELRLDGDPDAAGRSPSLVGELSRAFDSL